MIYQVIVAFTLHDLEHCVNTELKHGWTVTGGLITFQKHHIEHGLLIERNRLNFAQAMIRDQPEPCRA